MEPQHTLPTSTQPTPTETGVTTTNKVPIESVIESHIANPDVSRPAQDNPNLTKYFSAFVTTTPEFPLMSFSAPGNVIPEPTSAYSFAQMDKPIRIEPVPQVATVTPLHLLRENPTWIDCPFCERRAMTRVGHEDSSTTM